MLVGTVLLASLLYADIVHPMVFTSADGQVVLPFLPLMQLSVLCAALLVPLWGYALYLLLA
jgi:hypothetical protein